MIIYKKHQFVRLFLKASIFTASSALIPETSHLRLRRERARACKEKLLYRDVWRNFPRNRVENSSECSPVRKRLDKTIMVHCGVYLAGPVLKARGTPSVKGLVENFKEPIKRFPLWTLSMLHFLWRKSTFSSDHVDMVLECRERLGKRQQCLRSLTKWAERAEGALALCGETHERKTPSCAPCECRPRGGVDGQEISDDEIMGQNPDHQNQVQRTKGEPFIILGRRTALSRISRSLGKNPCTARECFGRIVFLTSLALDYYIKKG